MYYCICPVCMYVLFVSFLFDVLVHYCCLVTLGPTQDCCWDHPPFEIPKTTTACRGYLWSWYTTVAGSVSFFFDLLTLLLGNWPGTQLLSDQLSTGATRHCVVPFQLLARQHCSSHIQIRLGAEGPSVRMQQGSIPC